MWHADHRWSDIYIYRLKFAARFKFAHRELELDGWERKLPRTRPFISRETPSVKLMYIHDLGSNYLPLLPLKNISIGTVRKSVSVDQPKSQRIMK